jgi:ligand-binding SRPBCC domain-containing protein
MAFYQIKEIQEVTATLQEVWDFISSPKNLKKVTPEYMGFEITSGEQINKMYPGMIITYKVSPLLGINMNWMTEITHVENLKFFIDEQRLGPYNMWHHEHHIEEKNGKVLMTDIVTYIPPFGFLGAIANSLFIKNQLKEIFDYRRKAVDEYFKKR